MSIVDTTDIDELQEKAKLWDMVDTLRAPEGASVTLVCDNPEFNAGPNNKIEVTDDWTGWEPRTFEGDSIGAVIEAAVAARESAKAPKPTSTFVHNVHDRRVNWFGSWETAPLEFDKLTPADIGRTVIYRDHGRAEAGTITSYRDGIVFARYSTGDTASGAQAADLVFGIKRADSHPNTPPD